MENSKVNKYKRLKLWINSIFFLHLIVFLAVNTFLAFINLRVWPEELWFLWTLVPWGMGLFIHFGINMVIIYVLKQNKNDAIN